MSSEILTPIGPFGFASFFSSPGLGAAPGAAPGALAALAVADYDKRLKLLRIGKDKAGADRKIRLPDKTAALLDKAIKGKLPTAPLFARVDGKAWDKDAWKGPVKAAAQAAELPAATTRIDSSGLLPERLMPTYLPHVWSGRPEGPVGEQQRDEAGEHGNTQGVDRGGEFAVPGGQPQAAQRDP